MDASATAVALAAAAVGTSLIFIWNLRKFPGSRLPPIESAGDGRAELYQSYGDDGSEHERTARASLSDESLAQQRILDHE